MRDVNHKPRPAPMLPALSEMLRASDGILDLLPIATFICDAQGTILQYNRRAAELWGRAPRPGQTHDDFIQGARFWEADGTPVTRSLLAEVLTDGQRRCAMSSAWSSAPTASASPSRSTSIRCSMRPAR